MSSKASIARNLTLTQDYPSEIHTLDSNSLPVTSVLQHRLGLVRETQVNSKVEHLLSSIQLGLLIGAPGNWTAIGHHTIEAGIQAGVLERSYKGALGVTPTGIGFAQRAGSTVRWHPSAVHYMTTAMKGYLDSLNGDA
jgi:hypothetical protein